MNNLITNQEELISLIEKEFKTKDGYVGGERTINKTIISKSGEIVLSAYISNQSSIYYNYRIDMNAQISNKEIEVLIKTETFTSNGDPYWGRGMRKEPNNYTFNKSLTEFKSNKEIIEYISGVFYEHYFKINSRN